MSARKLAGPALVHVRVDLAQVLQIVAAPGPPGDARVGDLVAGQGSVGGGRRRLPGAPEARTAELATNG